MASIVYSTIVIVLVYDLFYVVPWAFIRGVFDISDVALVLVWLGLPVAVMWKKQIKILVNPISWMVIAYLLLVGVHIAFAAIHYNQTILNGFIAVRGQLFYLSFFVFCLLLDKTKKTIILLNLITIIALVVLSLSVLNYFGLSIFHHWRVEGWHEIRSGIRRAYIPGMSLLNFALLWQFIRWLKGEKNKRHYLAGSTLLLLAGHFFHQSRGQIWGLLGATVVILFLTRKYRHFILICCAGIVAAGVASVTMEENIVLNPFTTTVDDLSKGAGTVRGRFDQIITDLNEFRQHPWVGSGLIAVRFSKYESDRRMARAMGGKVRKQDLGYTHWMKMYGLVGIIWLAGFIWLLWRRGRWALRSAEEQQRCVALFAVAYLVFVIVSSVTLNHFMIPERIILLCLTAAIVVRALPIKPS